MADKKIGAHEIFIKVTAGNLNPAQVVQQFDVSPQFAENVCMSVNAWKLLNNTYKAK